MRLHSWLNFVYRRLTNLNSRPVARRKRFAQHGASVIVESLELRRLLTPGAAAIGFEAQVNSFTFSNQQRPAVGVDSTGAGVAAWESNNEDGSGYGIYAQRFDSSGAGVGIEFQVNTHISNDQVRPSVAMDGAGDFVIAWQSSGQDGSGFGIYAQRYDASGTPVGSEFRVNSFTTGDQTHPSVAIDSTGAFIVTWQSNVQDGNGYGVYAQRYSSSGAAAGSEFRVNSVTTGAQQAPAVAVDGTGNFVITWESGGQDGSGFGIYAQRYTAVGTLQGTEFQVNSYNTGDQSQPAVAMDTAGDFVITWQSFAQDGSNWGIEAQRYNSSGVAQGSEFQVNVYTLFAQASPSISMDSAGDFVVVWQSNTQDGSSYGVYGRRYSAAGVAQGGEFRSSTYTAGSQASPAVRMDGAGDFVVTWESDLQDGSGTGIYAQGYQATVGPIVTAVFGPQGGPHQIHNGTTVTSGLTGLWVHLSDDMNVVSGGANSITNPSNWILTRYGTDVSDQITGITFGFVPNDNGYAAVVSFAQALSDGPYQLTLRQTVQDVTGRILDGENDQVTGGDFRLNFNVAKTSAAGPETRVNTYTTSNQRRPVVAADAAGDYVAVWESFNQDTTGYGIYAQRYNIAGVPQGAEFRVNTYVTGYQSNPSVAMDAAGDFVITWQSDGQDGSGYGVYAQRYNSAGAAQGTEFRVNTHTTGAQQSSAVAMDSAGDFIITWESAAQDGDGWGIFARQYDANGSAAGSEFQVNTATTGNQTAPAVAMDGLRDFVIAWQSNDGNGDGIYGQRYNALGFTQGPEFKVNTFTTNNQTTPSVAMDSTGDFVIAWQSWGQDGDSYGIFAQRYNNYGFAKNGEFRVNTYTTLNQSSPSVSMDAAGDFVVTWSSDGQDGSISGVYAQRYSDSAVAQGGEFPVNTLTLNGQFEARVAMDTGGDFVVVWTSTLEDGDGYGVYSQRYKSDVSPWLSHLETSPLSAAAPLSTALTSSLQLTDIDTANLIGASIQITVNYRSDQDQLAFTNTSKITGSWNATTGTLTLTGVDTVSNYQAALRSVTYHNSLGSPNTSLVRTVNFRVTDGWRTSNVAARDINVMATTIPPVLSGVTGTGTYYENAAAILISSNLVITDPYAAKLSKATVSFSNWQAGDRNNFNNIFALQHTLTEDLTAHTALLTISGNETVDHYQTTLRSILFWNVSDNPVTSTRVASFAVFDALQSSNIVTRNIAVVAVNDRPVVSGIETTPLTYKANDPAYPPQPISATLLVTDADTNLSGATVQITSGYQNNSSGHDILSFTNQLGITGSFDASTGKLTLTGDSSPSNYRTALRSVRFSTSGSATSTATRTLTIIATDNYLPTHASSNPVTRNVTVSTTNLPPAMAGVPTSSLAYVRGAAALAISPGALVYDPDSINLASATIQITANYQNGQDVLAFTSGFGVTGSFNAATGTLTLTGITSLANYQSLLRSVTYKTNTALASTATRAISFVVNDSLSSSNAVTRSVTLT